MGAFCIKELLRFAMGELTSHVVQTERVWRLNSNGPLNGKRYGTRDLIARLSISLHAKTCDF